MAAPYVVGPIGQRFRRDTEGHRWYDIDWHIRTENQHQSHAYVLANWPLFAVGSAFNLSSLWPEIEGTDLWAFCTPELNIAPHRDWKELGPCIDWIVTQTWSTKQSWRCQTNPIENPLLEPVEMAGDFVHEQREAKVDRFGVPLRHPNFQPITGPAAERKFAYPTITFAFNSNILPLSTYVELINHVNDATLWGLPARCVRFADAKWQRLVYGNCFYYFRTTYTFEFNIETFDIDVPAEGTTELMEDGDSGNPEHFVPAKSPTGEVIAKPLDFAGRKLVKAPNGTFVYPQYIQRPQVHPQGNLLLLGIPSTL